MSVYTVISVWLLNFKDGEKARFLAKNQYTQRKPLHFENTGSASLSKIEVGLFFYFFTKNGLLN